MKASNRKSAIKCEGWRLELRRTYDRVKCRRKATYVVNTTVGFSETHYVCDDPQCLMYITGPYPASVKPISGGADPM